MSMRGSIRDALARYPALDAYFRRLVWSRVHFPESELKLLHALEGRPADVAVDIGAAKGSYTWLMNRMARRVIAFEPGQVHGDFLASALAGTRIELERMAVGRADAIVEMYTPGNDTDALHSATLSTGNPAASAPEALITRVRQVALDAYLAEKLAPGERLDLLKVDVEGYEGAVFEGAVQTIARDHPVVICEIEARHNAGYASVFALLRGLGYSTYVHRHGAYERFDGDDLAPLQRDADLAYRLSDAYRPGTGGYVNNFTFVHPNSALKVPL